jgi:hypothetical protein
MKSKTRISANKIANYLREVSVVVIGVAITLSLTLWISQVNEKRELSLYMRTVKIELEENKAIFENIITYFQSEGKYADYLLSHDKQLLNVDTLLYYSTQCATNRAFNFKINAFEMFKSSGIMRLLDDKELLLSLWNCYDNISFLQQILDMYVQEKKAEMKTERLSRNFRLLSPEDMKNAPYMRNFYSLPSTDGMFVQFEWFYKYTNEVSEKLEKYSKK